MSDQNASYPDQHAAPETTPAGAPRFVEQAMSHDQPVTEPPTNAQRGLGPFTLREWIIMALALLLLVLSFFAAVTIDPVGMHASVWSFGLTWLGAALFPFAAAVLIGVRRFAPRVQYMGALSVDQIASVAFCVAAFLWLNLAIILGQLSSAMSDMLGFFGGGSSSPVSVGATAWIAFVVSLAGIFFTIVARFVPPFAEDFTDREETTAHATARPARPIVAVPKPAPATQQASPYPYPAAGEQGVPPQSAAYGQYPSAVSQPPYAEVSQQSPYAAPGQQDAYAAPAQHEAPVEADVAPAPEQVADDDLAVDAADEPQADPATTVLSVAEQPDDSTQVFDAVEESSSEQAPSAQPFWALAPEQRDVHDFEGRQIYTIGPTAWALVLEDRGSYFVMRHDDGRIGYLHDTTNITRG